MPITGGVYTRSDGVRTGSTVNVTAQAAGAKCTSALADARENDLAAAINQCLFRDGSNAITSDMNLGSNRITALADGVAATDAATVGQIVEAGSFMSDWGKTLAAAATVAAARAILTPFPTGTTMAFYQATAPTGWTKVTTYDNAATRIVSGTPSSGGSVNFTTAFASQTPEGTIGGTSLSEYQMPSHTHTATVTDGGHAHVEQVNGGDVDLGGSTYGDRVSGTTYTTGGLRDASCSTKTATTGITVSNSSAGSGSSHSHSFTGSGINLAVKYVDCILCTCNAPT
jgi:hypothetical protein